MAKYSKFNIVYLLQKWMDSVPGQTFMNYAYSWGASIVILGTLFKLTHLPGANVMLFIGMGTEVFVFFIAAFDRPFDKTEDGKHLPTQTELDNELYGDEDEEYEDEPSDAEEDTENDALVQQGASPIVVVGETPYSGGVVGAPAPAVSSETAEAMETATSLYVTRLNELNELLEKVATQSERLTRDSEEMENLNRTLTGISRVYEMQLKSASQQIGTQDEINAKTKTMAEQIEKLNQIYARMIEAMTINVPGAQGLS